MDQRPKPIVLAVDDDTAMLTLLRDLLEDLGYEVKMADNGVAALKLFEEIDPDIVLTDIYMASGDGHELISAIRGKRRLIPILAMSGGIEAETTLEFARKLGADGIIPKPFRRADIVALIDRNLLSRPPLGRTVLR
jgi:CheY-like chemotaxis protein